MLRKVGFITLIVLICLSLGIGFGVVVYNNFFKIVYIPIDKSDSALGITTPKPIVESTTEFVDTEKEDKLENNVVNIALFGIDVRNVKEQGRSDAIMLLSVDFTKKTINLASIVRDLQVDIEGKKDKINHAYSYGGGQLSLKTINENFDLSYRNFITVNFYAFEKIVSKLGGLTIPSVTEGERLEINKRVKELALIQGLEEYPILETTGDVHLEGSQVVAYTRIRNQAGGDYARTNRQRLVLDLILKEINTRGVLEVLDIASSVLPEVATSLTEKEIFSLVNDYFRAGGNFVLNQERFPRDGEFHSDMSTGVYYLISNDMLKLKEDINLFLNQ